MAKEPKTTKETLGSILSYKRSINPSIGLWYNTIKEGNEPHKILKPIVVKTEQGTGSVSNHMSAEKTEKRGKEQKINEGNPFKSDVCETDIEANGFQFDFSILITPDSLEPDSNNLVSTRELLKEFSNAFSERNGYKILAEKYVSSLLSGRVLWRNRIAFNKVMTVTLFNGKEEKQVIIKIDDTYKYDELLTIEELNKYCISGNIQDIVDTYIKGLTEEPVRIDVSIYGDYPGGMYIYPSQEFIDNKKDDKSSDKNGKVLSSLEVVWDGKKYRQATTHSQKIGNALRTIDNLKSENSIFGITPIEAYGYSRKHGMALRIKVKDNERCKELGSNVYELLTHSGVNKLIDELKSDKISNDSLYLIACLIRGGVYGGE